MAESFDLDAIDDVIHAKLRLGVVAYLAGHPGAAFTELRERLNASDGNLSVHLRRLEEAGYVAVEKAFAGRKPVTRLSLTPAGRTAFVRYLEAFGRLVSQLR